MDANQITVNLETGLLAFNVLIIGFMAIDAFLFSKGYKSFFFNRKTQFEKDEQKLKHLQILKEIKEIENSGIKIEEKEEDKKSK